LTLFKILTFLIICICITSCSKFKEETNTLSGHPCLAMGHAGMGLGSNYPINSLVSIQTCLQKGSEGTEIDIQLTKDGVLVLFHDESLANTTEFEGKINDYNWSEIKHLSYKNTLNQTFPLIRLQDLFNEIENLHDYHFVFDCKLYVREMPFSDFIEQYTSALTTIIEAYQMEENIFIETHHTALIESIQEDYEELPILIIPSDFNAGFETASDYDLFGISISYDNISQEEIQLAHDAGFSIAVWNTYSSFENILALNKQPDIIETDRIEHLLSIIPE
jgi:glycerophosphoryl diester phosphodiesterase